MNLSKEEIEKLFLDYRTASSNYFRTLQAFLDYEWEVRNDEAPGTLEEQEAKEKVLFAESEKWFEELDKQEKLFLAYQASRVK